MKRTLARLARLARLTFAPYVVVDSYGTVQAEWTLDNAMEWLEFTSPHTMIWHRWNGALVASRIQD